MQQYYRPWDLLPDEETRIEDQLDEVQTRIDKEVAEFELEKKKRLAELDGKVADKGPEGEQEPAQPVVTESVQDGPVKAETPDTADSEPTPKPADVKNDSSNGIETSEVAADNEGKGEADVKMNEDTSKGEEKQQEEAEDDGDHIEEGDEDNVIY